MLFRLRIGFVGLVVLLFAIETARVFVRGFLKFSDSYSTTLLFIITTGRFFILTMFILSTCIRDRIKPFGTANYQSLLMSSKSETSLLQLFHES